MAGGYFVRISRPESGGVGMGKEQLSKILEKHRTKVTGRKTEKY
jgi:hypothetical protein